MNNKQVGTGRYVVSAFISLLFIPFFGIGLPFFVYYLIKAFKAEV
jgi:hypothetical protein